ncbi:MAG: hypothetical protein D6800_11505 [Candidatus Zixiibacteriota bacterium]|nr:MAG: hypothetical protein D6800_11505 [candidate division Zixibacteria bacterium]
MSGPDRKAYMRLIDEILHLLVKECRLKRQCGIEHDGMALGLNDEERRRELAAVEEALEHISRRHGRLVELLRQRVQLKDCLHHPPFGNAGHYRHLHTRDLLRDNKRQISRLLQQGG